jgi:hypothetical protein
MGRFSMCRNLRFVFLALALAVLASSPSFASTVAFTTLASFQSATSGLTTENFDAATAPLVIANGGTYGQLKFNYTINGGGGLLEIVNLFPTTSSPNYLGSDDPATGAFFASDSLTITLPHPVSAFGLYIVGNGGYLASTFTLNIGLGTAQNSATPDVVIDAFGDVAYFVGITSTSAFSSATIALTTPGNLGDGPLWNVDDVTWGKSNTFVPEPGTMLLIATGLVGVAGRLRKRAC